MSRTRTRSCWYYHIDTDGNNVRPPGQNTTEYINDIIVPDHGWKEVFHCKLNPKSFLYAAPNWYGRDVHISGLSCWDQAIPYVPYLTHISQGIKSPRFDFQTNNKFDIGQALYEFKDTFELFTINAVKNLNSIGSGILAWEFGYKQIISDVSSLISTYYDLRTNIKAEINAKSGTKKSARFVSTGSDFKITYGVAGGERYELYMDYTINYLGTITYNFPEIDEIPLAALLDEFGVPKNPLKLVWAVSKFSWLVDWITNSIVPKMIDHLMPLLSGSFYNPTITFNGWTIYKCQLKVKRFNKNNAGYLASEGKYFRRRPGSFSPGDPPKPIFNFLPDDRKSFDALVNMVGTLSDSLLTGNVISRIRKHRR